MQEPNGEDVQLTPEQERKQFANLDSIAFDAFSSGQDFLLEYIRDNHFNKKDEQIFLRRIGSKITTANFKSGLKQAIEKFHETGLPDQTAFAGASIEEIDQDNHTRSKEISRIVSESLNSINWTEDVLAYPTETRTFFEKVYSMVLFMSVRYSKFAKPDNISHRSLIIADIVMAKIKKLFDDFYNSRSENTTSVSPPSRKNF